MSSPDLWWPRLASCDENMLKGLPWTAALIELTLIVVTAGCSRAAGPMDDDVHPEESKAEMLDLFAESIDLLQRGAWTTELSSAQPCAPGGKASGAQFSLLRVGPGSANAARDADRIADFWRSKGLVVTRSVIDRGTVEQVLHAQAEVARVFEFEASEYAMTLSGQSACLEVPS